MARVHIDVNMISVAWFTPVLEELIKCDRVQFVVGNSATFKKELGKARKLLQVYRVLRDMRAVGNNLKKLDANIAELERHEAFIAGQSCFIASSDCDDPHIFALVHAKPTKYVFSTDKRLASCRDYINNHVDSRYCKFIVVSALGVYQEHRQAILN